MWQDNVQCKISCFLLVSSLPNAFCRCGYLSFLFSQMAEIPTSTWAQATRKCIIWINVLNKFSGMTWSRHWTLAPISLGPAFSTNCVAWTHAGVVAWAETPCLRQGGSFSARIHIANNKTYADTGTAQALFSDQRMEKRELSSQINFSTLFRWRHHINRRVEVKARELERVGGILTTSLRKGVWFGPRTDATILLVLVWDFPIVVMATVNCQGACGCVI